MDLTKEILEIIDKNKEHCDGICDVIYDDDFEKLAKELNDLFALQGVTRSFIESEIKQCEVDKKRYGWICSHYRNYYEGRISAYEKILLFEKLK